jgi:uncharacterized protein with HEPN domain
MSPGRKFSTTHTGARRFCRISRRFKKDEDRDAAYLWDIRKFALESHGNVRRVTFTRLEKDSIRRLALERTLELVGEGARRVSPAFQKQHPEIDWRGLIGQRNVIAHDYGEINHRRLYQAARVKIPLLLEELDRILDGV